MLRILRNKGYAVEEALRYCAGSEQIYKEVLHSALVEGKQKMVLLDECIKKRDFARYGIEVHGIGNVAKTIGALDFHKEARIQNERIKEGAYEQAAEGHLSFRKAYEKMLRDIEGAI